MGAVRSVRALVPFLMHRNEEMRHPGRCGLRLRSLSKPEHQPAGHSRHLHHLWTCELVGDRVPAHLHVCDVGQRAGLWRHRHRFGRERRRVAMRGRKRVRSRIRRWLRGIYSSSRPGKCFVVGAPVDASNDIIVLEWPLGYLTARSVIWLLARLFDCSLGYLTARSVIWLLARLFDCSLGYLTARSVIWLLARLFDCSLGYLTARSVIWLLARLFDCSLGLFDCSLGYLTARSVIWLLARLFDCSLGYLTASAICTNGTVS